MGRSIAFSLWFVLLFPACKQDGAPSDLVIPRAASPIVVDGRLDEPAWKRAADPGPLKRFDGRAGARQATRVRITWNRDFLFFGFECQDRDVKSSYTRRDQPLYLQEVVEIFLDPDRDRKDYMEFEVSPRGILFDAAFKARRKGINLNFNPSSKVYVIVDGSINDPEPDRSWTVELAIPFAGMTGRGRRPPQPGDRWGMNLFRLDKTNNNQEATSWKPTAGDFHDLNAFGVIRFER